MTTVIAGGLLADGTGEPLYRADVAIDGWGRIAGIGRGLRGDQVLDARGAIVAPGFIDIHTHYDAQLFWDPGCTPSSWQGVTTVVVGNCGFGLAPCRIEHRALLVRMLVELEDMPAPVLEAGIDWSFTSFGEYMDRIVALRPSVNVAAYVGHSPLRIEAMGEAAFEREATDAEVDRMARLVEEAMRDGAAGFATSSSPSGRRSATAMASESELLALSRAMASSGRGVVALVPGGRSMSRERMYQLQPLVGRPFTWTALMAIPDGRHREWLALHREWRERGADVRPQVSGRPQVAQTTLRSGFSLRAPSMLALEGKPEEERLRAYRDPSWRMKLAAELDAIPFPVEWRRWIVDRSPRHPEYDGRNIGALANELGVAPMDALLDVALRDSLDTRFTVVQCNDAEDEVAGLLTTEGAVLGLADSGAHPDQICDAVLPTDFLGKWVRDKRVMAVEKAVRKLTGELADLFGFDRGYLRVGAPADIAVFDPETIGPGPFRRVHDLPAGGERIIADRPEGLRHVLVNGVPIRRDGAALPRGAGGGNGRVIRHA